jgi:hypothetical protein
MKTFVCVVVVAGAMIASQCNAAQTGFSFYSAAGEAKNNLGGNLPSGRTMLAFADVGGNGIGWHNLWIDATDGGTYGAYGTDDIYLGMLQTSAGPAGGKYNTADFVDSSGTYVGKNVYGVLLDLAYGSPVADLTYCDAMSGTKGPLTDTTPPAVPQTFTDGLLQTSTQIHIVPEPMTLGLATLGLCAIVIKRRRQKQ